MNNFRYILFYPVFILLCLPIGSQAQQEAHYSQYMFNTLLINPAYAGAREQASMNLLMRAQWLGFPGAPRSQSFSLHAPSADQRHGFGLLVSNDEVGPLSSTGLGLDYAYRIPLDANSSLAFGLQGTLDYYRTGFNGLNLEDNTDNSFAEADIRRFMPNAGFGIYYQHTRFYAGASIPRLLRNNLSNTGDDPRARQFRHYYLTGGVLLDLSPNLVFRPSTLLKYASSDGPQIDLNASFVYAQRVMAGISWRSEDAIVVLAEFWPTKQLRIGYAYDFSTSQLRNFNSGSHEFMLGFDFSFDKNKVVSPRYF
ncbi:MAG: type IX secretion system membrane protein PorP/SprF [Bacteroidota bacterium]